MRKMIALLCIVLVVSTLSGCAPDDVKIAGKWYFVAEPSRVLEFRGDGQAKVYVDDYVVEGKWCLDDDYLVLDGERIGYELSGNTLILKYQGERIELRKK